MVGTAALAIATPARSGARSRRSLPLRQARHHDRPRTPHPGNAIRDVMRDEGKTQELDDHCADEGTENSSAPTGKWSAAHRDRRDGIELHIFSDPVWIGGAIDR